MPTNIGVLGEHEFRAAEAALDEAQKALQHSDDLASLGNISSCRLRLARRRGEYADALAHGQAAVTAYRRCDPEGGHRTWRARC